MWRRRGNRRWPAFASALEIVPFRWVWTAALSGNSGRFAIILVAGWEAFRLGHHSSLWPSLVSALLLIPTTFLGLLTGGIADRVNRAKQAAAGQAVNAVACATAAALALDHRLGLVSLLAVCAVAGCGNAVQGPAWQSMVPRLVGPERLLNASAVIRIAQQGAELTGPALGTLALTSFGPGAGFGLCTAFYLGGASMLWRVRKVASGAVVKGMRNLGLTQGAAYIGRQPPLGTLLAWVGLHCSLTMAFMGILPAVASANLSGRAGAYGLLMTAFGVGSVAGPVLLMLVGDRGRPAQLLVASGLLSGLPLIGIGMAHQLPLALAASAVAGAGQAVFMAGIYSCTMTVASDEFRGRVSSVQLSLTTGVMGAASLGWGALVGLLAPGVVLAAPGAAFALACVPFGLRAPAITHRIMGHRRRLQQPEETAGQPAPRTV